MSRLARYFSRFVRDVAPCAQILAICAWWTHFARSFLQFLCYGHSLHALFCNLCGMARLARKFSQFVWDGHTLLANFRNLCVVGTLCTQFSTICERWTHPALTFP